MKRTLFALFLFAVSVCLWAATPTRTPTRAAAGAKPVLLSPSTIQPGNIRISGAVYAGSFITLTHTATSTATSTATATPTPTSTFTAVPTTPP